MSYTDTDTTRGTKRVLDQLNRLGVTTPRAVTAAVKTADQARGRLAYLDRATETVPAMASDYLAGRDIDQDILDRAVLGQLLQQTPGARHQIEQSINQPVTRAVRDHTDKIIEAVRPLFDQAADKITTARAALNGLPLTDLAAITALGGDAAEHWAQASKAEKTIAQVVALLQALNAAKAYPAIQDPRERMLTIATIGIDQYIQLPSNQATGAYTLAGHGTLNLATPAEYTTRLSEITTAWADHPRNRDRGRPEGPGAGQYPEAPARIGEVAAL